MSDAPNDRPVFVDLDGTLIASDLLAESFVQLLRRDPWAVLRLPSWLARGRARLKAEIARRVSIDAARLPYRPEVLAYLREQRALGRRIVLATASDARLARSVAAHHAGLFDDVIASDGERNEKGDAKLETIRARAGAAGFEYLGNSAADLPIWRAASQATLVAPTAAARRGAAALGVPTRTLVPPRRSLAPLVAALRPQQWVKNVLLFVPLVLAHRVADLGRWLDTAVVFAAFCCVASATYVFNDLLDIEADRRHETKRARPFAAGTLPIPVGFALMASLFALGFGLVLALATPAALAVVAIYAGATTAYSLYFKERLAIDVLVLAGLYTHRVLAGVVAADVPFSPWLLAFSLFFFLSLAYVKRYVELVAARARDEGEVARRGYRVDDTGLVESLGLVSGYMSVLVLCLYISARDVGPLYGRPALLWLVVPVLLYWITRVWFLARRGAMPADPVRFAVTDRTSYLAVAAIGAVGVAATLLR